MLFCSEQFLLFFLAVFTVYWLLPWPRPRVYLLLGASLYFYASWNKWLALLIAGSTAADWAIGRALEASSRPRVRRALVSLSIVGNLGILAYFKYANFFLRSLSAALSQMGIGTAFPVLCVILPIGISFYTFEAINYTVDVYRRRVRAEKSLPNLMLFVLFFPHLVAGPIVRARDFLPQIGRRKRWDWARTQVGVQLFLMGLFKKLAVADRMAMAVDPVFANPSWFSTGAVWLATLAYAIQIYCDFSGYSDMALGLAHLFGYRLAQNFNLPYVSLNVSEFWRRWHISLSSWLRDYLYIPLGGNRRGWWRTHVNLMATMALGGLWHGASWTFVLWGVLHGLYLIVHRTFHDWVERRPRLEMLLQTWVGTAARAGLTFLCVAGAWVLFRAPSLTQAGRVLWRLAVPTKGLRTVVPTYTIWTLVAVLGVSHALALWGQGKRLSWRLPGPVLGLGYALTAVAALVLAPMLGKAFIYFQF